MFYYKGHSMLTTLPSPSAQTIRQSVPDQEDIIRRSLERSARYGVDPHLDGAPESTRLSDEQLRERINGQRVFYTLAKEQIDSLYRLLRDTGFCMALADSEGYVLYVVGDSDLVEHFKRRRCIPGYRWTERDIGTCAIGLSLEERVPVFLPGDRMYSAQARKISNAGAPVFSLDGGRVLGAISLSGGSDMMHIHTLGLVRQAAETVTSQLRERERIRELAIKNQYMRALVESDSRGIVTVDQTGRIVEANSTARKLLKLSPGCEGKSFEESVGGLRTVPVDLRIISATNKDLKQAIAQHQFRADLYYRISTLSILVPPLRERAEDILPLAEHFIHRHELRLNRHPVPLPQETAEAILRYPWPGNIRQLESAVERAVHLAEGGALLPEHFGIADLMENRRPAAPAPAQATLEDIERQAIAAALVRFGGNISQTAFALGVSRPTLYRKMSKYGLEE